MKKMSIGAAVTLAVFTAAITVSITYRYAMDRFNTKIADVNERQAMYTKLSEMDQKVRQDYMGTINETNLKNSICAGYIAGLSDAEAKYLSAEKYRARLQGAKDENIGVGIRTIQDSDGNMEIVEVMPGSAAEKSGLKKGDVILAIDEQDVVRIGYTDAVVRLHGAAGSKVTLKVLRALPKSEKNALPQISVISVTRAQYQVKTVKSDCINGNVGYIAIRTFAKSTPEAFKKEVEKLKKKQICGLILDLRSNDGGKVENMAKVADMLLPACDSVRSINKKGKINIEHVSGASNIKLPVIAVVNSGTFGAAEILASDLQSQGGKTPSVIGTSTAGTAAKEQIVPLSDGSALILTVAHYITPDGQDIFSKGISPDKKITLSTLDNLRFLRGNLSLAEDSQVQAAVTALVAKGAHVKDVPGSE